MDAVVEKRVKDVERCHLYEILQQQRGEVYYATRVIPTPIGVVADRQR
jgi:hypothetical protein